MPSILIFHEDPEYRASLADSLCTGACQVTQCAAAGEMLQRLQDEAFDLLILDPGSAGRGAGLLAEVRRVRATQPILVITEQARLETALEALHYKVCDYLECSMPADQLLGRIRKILSEIRAENDRKTILDQMQAMLDHFHAFTPAHAARLYEGAGPEKSAPPEACLERGAFTVHLSTREAFWQGRAIALSPAEFSYWVVLLRHEPNVISHKALVLEAQGYDLGGREAMSLARWHIHMLRQTLAKELGTDPIQTIRGVGYRLMI